jgi:hypothetical protein
LLVGSSGGAEWIGLTDQPRQFSQRVAIARGRIVRITAAIILVRGKRSALVSISHLDDASPAGKPTSRFY